MMGEAKRRRATIKENIDRMKRGEHDYGDAPIEKRYREQMVAIMETLNEFVNADAGKKETAIVVMMFPFGENPGRCNYMSNGVDRKDMVTLMKEMIARFEGMPHTTGRA